MANKGDNWQHRRPPQCRICNLYDVVKVVQLKSWTGSCPMDWLIRNLAKKPRFQFEPTLIGSYTLCLNSSFARGQIHRAAGCWRADCQTEKLREPWTCCQRSTSSTSSITITDNQLESLEFHLGLLVSGHQSSNWRSLSEWTHWKLLASMTTYPRLASTMKRSRTAGVILRIPRLSSKDLFLGIWL